LQDVESVVVVVVVVVVLEPAFTSNFRPNLTCWNAFFVLKMIWSLLLVNVTWSTNGKLICGCPTNFGIVDCARSVRLKIKHT
jgi:hypothetical protein